MVKYLQRVGIALSVLFNVILGGPSNQTFSARNWGWKRVGRPNLVWLIDGITNILADIYSFFLTIYYRKHIVVSFKDHCMTSWIYWRSRKDVIYELDTDKQNRME